MFAKILRLPLKPVATCGKSSISDVLAIFAKLLPICLLNLIKIYQEIQYCARSNYVNLCSTFCLKMFLQTMIVFKCFCLNSRTRVELFVIHLSLATSGLVVIWLKPISLGIVSYQSVIYSSVLLTVGNHQFMFLIG